MDVLFNVLLMIPVGLILLYVWLKRREAPRKKHKLSEEAMEELQQILTDYRGIITEETPLVADARLLPHPRETIKEYLQVAIGLARLNGEPLDRLMAEYYLLARFQHIDDGDEQVLTIVETESEAVPETEEGMAGQLPGETGPEKYLRRVAEGTPRLEAELQAFLKRKAFF